MREWKELRHAYGPAADTRFPVRTFDYDFDNKPVIYEGAAAVNNYIGSLFDVEVNLEHRLARLLRGEF